MNVPIPTDVLPGVWIVDGVFVFEYAQAEFAAAMTGAKITRWTPTPTPLPSPARLTARRRSSRPRRSRTHARRRSPSRGDPDPDHDDHAGDHPEAVR